MPNLSMNEAGNEIKGHETFHILQTTSSILAIIMNAFSFCIIKRYSRPEFGNYKYLMMIFAIFGIYYAFIEILTLPSLFDWGHTKGFFPTSFIRRTKYASAIGCLYPSAYAMSLVVIAVHFIYRYFAICRIQWLYWFNFPHCLIWVVIFIIYSVNYWASVYFGYHADQPTIDSLREPLYHEYGIDIDNIDLMATMYFVTTPDGLVPRWKDLAVCIDMLFLVAIVLTVIIFFCIRIQTALRNNIVMSAKTKRLQTQLFKALFCQTIVPIATGFGPVSVFYFAPLVGWNLGKYTNLISVILSFYPLCDPIVVLMMIADYRRAIYRMMTCQRATRRVSSTGNTSNRVDHSLSKS
ncbi:hypothetical protein WR25_09918 [Diploscapter pachys]|uniref:G-protein coupled receptors family 1 profile domain-containing protein n=1 Tax=Diploscapter pachys TaxID=2018661 RepID=A0A2A2JYM8_9BILA|nr:hypothetical protein WR25_09918 [Diploscapter pachys]